MGSPLVRVDPHLLRGVTCIGIMLGMMACKQVINMENN